MPTIAYQTTNFRPQTLGIIKTANNIIAEYQAEGYELTLRQLYYQFVARDIIPNKDSEYKKLGDIINNARLAGLVDWDAIIDRTRSVRSNSHWDGPEDIIKSAAYSFRIDTRATQNDYIEVWVEKDALVGVVERICKQFDIQYLSCRGYVSQSAMWRAARRFIRQEQKRSVTVMHLGDHDPSGLDMTRDIQKRLELFRSSAAVHRIALNMDQIERYNPPPNPAKVTDSRYDSYLAEFGSESWELDALDPRVITDLITYAAAQYTSRDKRQLLLDKQQGHKHKLQYIADNWKKVSKLFES